MLKKTIILLVLLLFIFQGSIYAVVNEAELKEVYLADTDETYLIEGTEHFDNLARPLVAVALGGGGARGFVNIGVLKALQEERIPVDMVCGTSMGAVIAVLYGSGLPLDEIEKVFTTEILESIIDVNFPFTLLSSRKLNYILQEISPVNNLEDFPIPTALLSLDLKREARLIHTMGEVQDVIKGAYAIPVVFPVARYHGSYLVDPGMVELTPACTAKLLGADLIISTTAYDKLPYDRYDLPFRAWMKMINIIKEKNSRRIVDKYSDAVIEHEVGDYSYMDFSLVEKFINMGYKLTKEKIPEIKKILKQNDIIYKNYDYSDYYQSDKFKEVEALLGDIKNDRVIYNFTDIKPILNYGTDNFIFNQGYFKKRQHKVQYGLELEHKNKEIIFMLEGNSGNKYEFATRIKKITPSLDLRFLYSNKGNNLYDLLLLDYRENFTTATGLMVKDNVKYFHFKNNYDFKLNSTGIKGSINVLHTLDNSTDLMNESVFENEVIFPVNFNWDIHLKCVNGKTDILSVPEIYRGVTPVENSGWQGSFELRNDYQFIYSQEIVDLFQISGLEFYQFVDFIDLAEPNYAVGSGLELNLNILGIKPMVFTAYLSYDLNSKSYQTGLGIDISL